MRHSNTEKIGTPVAIVSINWRDRIIFWRYFKWKLSCHTILSRCSSSQENLSLDYVAELLRLFSISVNMSSLKPITLYGHASGPKYVYYPFLHGNSPVNLKTLP